jgi:uncharacterized protein (DUF1330 family)
MTTYLIVNATITDPAGLDAYGAAVRPTLAGHDVKVLVSTNEATALEGSPGERAVVLEFPNRAAAEAWYHSPAYQAVIGLRLNSTNGIAIFAEGR